MAEPTAAAMRAARGICKHLAAYDADPEEIARIIESFAPMNMARVFDSSASYEAQDFLNLIHTKHQAAKAALKLAKEVE
jgi:hypothetical protein